jgi:hypothetical protein
MKSVRVAVLACLLAAGPGVVVLPADAAPQPTISVSRTTGLSRGSVVTVRGAGISPRAAVRVIQCDSFSGTVDSGDCPDVTTKVADSSGRVSARVKLGDPVWKEHEFGDPSPVYCRSDECRLFLVWGPGTSPSVLASAALEFPGSPATIAVRPSSALPDLKWVAVTGTALGAEGHTIKVLEQGCFDIIQATGCYGQLPLKWGKVRADGTYRVKYPARRHLAEGTDCAATSEILGGCVVSVIVLDSLGRHDDTFGVRDRGEPYALLSFSGTAS